MIFLSLMLAPTLPQTATSGMSVRARVAQTCVVTTTRVTCRGALDRPGQARISTGQYAPEQGVVSPGAQDPRGQARVIYGGQVTVVEF